MERQQRTGRPETTAGRSAEVLGHTQHQDQRRIAGELPSRREQ